MRGMISPLYAAADRTSQDIYTTYNSQLIEFEKRSHALSDRDLEKLREIHEILKIALESLNRSTGTVLEF